MKIESQRITKKIKGQQIPYIKVVIRKKGKKTITKQYKYLGGNFRLYERQAQLPKGTRYAINYDKNTIYTNPKRIEALYKKVATRKRKPKKAKKTITKEIKPLPSIKIRHIPHPKTPLGMKTIHNLMPNKVFYERTHTINDFLGANEQKTIKQIIGNTTTNTKDTNALTKNLEKIKYKFSYTIEIKGITDTGKEETPIVFQLVGKTPKQVINILKQAELTNQGEEIDNTGSTTNQKLREVLAKNGEDPKSVHGERIRFKISNINIHTKFYNNPSQRILGR